MAQDDIMSIIEKHPEGITGNGIKTALEVNWGVTQQVERLREKGLVTKKQGETRLTWIYYPVKKSKKEEAIESITPDYKSGACPVRDMGNRLTRRHK